MHPATHRMRPLYIFDLDGTLALIEHRRHFVECERGKQDWTAFYAACDEDVPNEPVLQLFRLLAMHADVLIFSGRSDEVRGKTIAWLAQHVGMIMPARVIDERLTMRPAGDYAPDDVLKAGWLSEMLADDRERLVAVFEDRDRMVKMWRSYGIACFQVAPGEF